MKTIEKLPRWLLGLVLLLVLFAIIAAVYHGKETGTRYLSVTMKPAMTSMDLTWKKDPKARSYRILRYDMTKEIENEIYDVPKSKYEETAVIPGTEDHYTDTDVEMGHTYTYLVLGFRQADGGGLLTCTSYNPDTTNYEVVGLSKPDLFNNGDGENYSNTNDCLYLYPQINNGAAPEGYQLTRKVVGKTGYEPLKLVTAEGGAYDTGLTLVDRDVTFGKTYRYKFRTVGKADGKTVYSPWSNVVEIPLVNQTGSYEVELKEDSVLRIVSDPENGDLVISPDLNLSRSGPEGDFDVAVTGFRKDDTEAWQKISEEVVLAPGESLELQLKSPEGVTLGAEDVLYAEYRLYYKGPAGRPTAFTADLSKGKAEATAIYD